MPAGNPISTLVHLTLSRDVVEILIVVLGTFVATAVALFLTCAERSECIADGRCFPSKGMVLSGCSFVACSVRSEWVAPLQTFVSKSVSTPSDTIGICPPGLSVVYSKIDERPVCKLQRIFPSAFNPATGIAGSKRLVQAACGKWADTVDSSGNGLTYLGIGAAAESVEAMVRVTRYALGVAHAPVNDAMSFKLACDRLATATVQTMQADVVQGYNRILSHVNSALDTSAHTFNAAATLLGFGCDGFVELSVYIDSNGFILRVQDGALLSAGLVKQALSLVGESPATAEAAFEWFRSKHESTSAPCDWVPTTPELLQLVLKAALIGATSTDVESALQSDVHNNPPSMIVDPASLHALRKLVCTMRPSAGASVGQAESAIKGVAAVCAASVMANRFDRRWETPIWPGMREYAASRQSQFGRPRALGRLAPRMHSHSATHGIEHGPISETDWRQATGQTLGTLIATVDARVADHGPGDVASCQDITDALFPEQMEHALYASSVSSALAMRVKRMTDDFKVHLAAVLRTEGAMRALFENPDAIALGVERSRVAIAGEPRSSPPAARITSNDGPTTQGLLQSAAMTSDRLKMALLGEDICSHPPLLDPEDINAYYLHPFGCVYLSVGILLAPFADQAYDDFSLLANLGFVIAHELGHNSYFSRIYMATVESTLHRYGAGAYTEAISDVLAAVTLMSYTNTKDYTQFALFQAQTWCAVAGDGYVHNPSSSHPDPVRRVELLCETVDALEGYTCGWTAA